MQDKREIKTGAKVWWIEYINNIAYVFEGEYIDRVDGTYEGISYLVKDSYDRNILVSSYYENKQEALEKAYLHNRMVAETNKKDKEEYEELKKNFWKLTDRVETLEKKKFKLF